MNIGKRIKEIRIRRGLTEKQLGEKIGKSASAISNYENNFRGLNAEILVKIIKVLDV
ncbi:MAG: helix-turn-helix transcriptional regulator, partial [Erysipelotrichaceae bacterium]|nr:helix-turn-helix transcriptional regulator [Erysipelotrichaceae bacterium]